MTDLYQEFLRCKVAIAPPCGIATPIQIHSAAFGWQRDIDIWALRRGRAAIFSDCGTGKTFMQLEWSQHIPGRILILAPLAVTYQTVREAERFEMEPVTYCRSQAEVSTRVTITNYEMLDKFDPSAFSGVVLDESSILKHQDSRTRQRLIDAFRNTPYRLACTATPAPNDVMELGNHAEFLGVMTRAEMLSMFFVHDGGETQKWRLKGHAQQDFWRWLASWVMMVRKPSDLGYSDDGFELPPLEMHEHVLRLERNMPGQLFAMEALTLQERITARRVSVTERVSACAEMVNASAEQWIVWCNLNAESSALAAAIPDAIEIRGSDSLERKETALFSFLNGQSRVLISKPSICGFGVNMQCCHNVVFVGLSDSWEQFYQAVRRCYRFGQKHPVDVHLIVSDAEGAVLKNIKGKEASASKMGDSLVSCMREAMHANLKGAVRTNDTYQPKTPMELPAWLTA